MKTHHNTVIHFLLFILSGFTITSAEEYTVLQWNIWQEGTQVKGGYDAIVNEINRLSPDFVTLSEVRNYNGIDFLSKLVADLDSLGNIYYTTGSYDSGLLSKYPIEQFDTISPLRDDHGTIYRLYATSPSGDRFAIYTAHLDYLNCASYEPRGYSGNTWEEVEPVTDVEELLYKNDLSYRDDEIRLFIDAANKDIQDGRTVIIGGDFNEPSFLDWQENTSSLWDHKGLIVPWTVSRLLYDAGFTDSFREIYPDPVKNPGFTFPSANPDVDMKRLTWAPKSDERERIDFIYYNSPRQLKVTEARVFGPLHSIEKSQITDDPGSEDYIMPLGVWPTDHKGLFIRFRM